MKTVSNENVRLQIAAYLGTDSEFCLKNEPAQWICWDFKALRIEPRPNTIRTSSADCHLKTWAVEGSGDEAGWTETNQRENNSHLNYHLAVKTFAVAGSGLFPRIRLRQTGKNPRGNNFLVFKALFAISGGRRPLQGSITIEPCPGVYPNAWPCGVIRHSNRFVPRASLLVLSNAGQTECWGVKAGKTNLFAKFMFSG
jgi:hypothetical protein